MVQVNNKFSASTYYNTKNQPFEPNFQHRHDRMYEYDESGTQLVEHERTFLKGGNGNIARCCAPQRRSDVHAGELKRNPTAHAQKHNLGVSRDTTGNKDVRGNTSNISITHANTMRYVCALIAAPIDSAFWPNFWVGRYLCDARPLPAQLAWIEIRLSRNCRLDSRVFEELTAPKSCKCQLKIQQRSFHGDDKPMLTHLCFFVLGTSKYSIFSHALNLPWHSCTGGGCAS